MTARQALNNGENGSVIRGKINDNFTAVFAPRTLSAFGSADQTIANATWTAINWDSVTVDTTGGITPNPTTGEIVFNMTGAAEQSGIWMCAAYAAWENNIAGLQMHVRKIRFRSSVSGFGFTLAESDLLFDPAMGVTGVSVRSHQTCYVQILNDIANPNLSIYAEVWHNAKVAGSPVSMKVKALTGQTPCLTMSRLANYP